MTSVLDRIRAADPGVLNLLDLAVGILREADERWRAADEDTPDAIVLAARVLACVCDRLQRIAGRGIGADLSDVACVNHSVGEINGVAISRARTRVAAVAREKCLAEAVPIVAVVLMQIASATGSDRQANDEHARRNPTRSNHFVTPFGCPTNQAPRVSDRDRSTNEYL